MTYIQKAKLQEMLKSVTPSIMDNPQYFDKNPQSVRAVGGFRRNRPYTLALTFTADKAGGIKIELAVNSYYKLYDRETNHLTTYAIPNQFNNQADNTFGLLPIVDHLYQLLKLEVDLTVPVPKNLQRKKEAQALIDWTVTQCQNISRATVIDYFQTHGLI